MRSVLACAADQAAICARPVRPSLTMMCRTCVSAVLAEITSLAAMSGVGEPLPDQGRDLAFSRGEQDRTGRPGSLPGGARWLLQGRRDRPCRGHRLALGEVRCELHLA